MIIQILTLTITSSLPFLFSLTGDFVFDDSVAVIKNKDVSADSWIKPFYNDFWGTNIKSNLSHKSYRPLAIVSFRLNYFLNNKEFSAVHFKVTNLLCHILCCLLVQITFNIIVDTVGPKYKSNKWGQDIPYLAALMFSVHPVHVEAVSGIVGRADLLAANTFFLAFICYTKARNSSKIAYLYLIATTLLATVSMLFKENGITVLGFCITYEVLLTKIRTKKRNKNSKKSNICVQMCDESFIRILFLILSIVLLLYGRWMVMGGTKPKFEAIDNPAAFANNIFTKVATYNYIYFLNILLFIWPQWLCYDWSMGCVPLIDTVYDYRLFFVSLLYLYESLILVALIGRRNNARTKRLILLGLSLMIIPFLPAANIFYPVGFVIAERILYISSAGYCLLFATGLIKIIYMDNEKRYKLIMALFSVLILINGLRSWQRSHDWQNEYNLFVNGLTVCPLNAKVHYNVAKVSDAKEQTVRAMEEYEEAIRIRPDYYQAMNNLANLLKKQNKFEQAELYLKRATNLKHDFPSAWMNLGIVLANMKRYEESLAAYQNALKYRKNYPDCHYNLGNVYLELNDTTEAVASWLKAINLNSKHVLAWTNVLALLDNTGQLNKAIEIIPNALTDVGDVASVNFAIGNIYGKLDRYSEAEKHFKKAIELFENKVQAIHFANLGVLYHRWKKYDLAKEMYRKALRIDPHFKSALRNLKALQ